MEESKNLLIANAIFALLVSVLLLPTEIEAKNKKKERSKIRLKESGEPSSLRKSKADLEREANDPFAYFRQRRLQSGITSPVIKPEAKSENSSISKSQADLEKE